jgi:hypothetical protein
MSNGKLPAACPRKGGCLGVPLPGMQSTTAATDRAESAACLWAGKHRTDNHCWYGRRAGRSARASLKKGWPVKGLAS